MSWQWQFARVFILSQRTHDVIKTPSLCQNNVATSFWRNDDVIFLRHLSTGMVSISQISLADKLVCFPGNCRLYSNISQVLMLCKTWRYYNKFDSPKSLGVCYWCVKIPQCGYMELGLKHISFYVQKHIVALAMCYNPALVRDKPLGAPESVKLKAYGISRGSMQSWWSEIMNWRKLLLLLVPTEVLVL